MTTKTKTAETVESVLEASKGQFEDAFKTTAAASQKSFEKAAEFSRKQIDESLKMFDEVTKFSKGNVDALMASGQAAGKGFEELAKATADYSRTAFAEFQNSFKSLTGAKTAKDFFELHNVTAKKAYDGFVAEASKMSELAVKTINEAVEPLSSRMAATADIFAKPAK